MTASTSEVSLDIKLALCTSTSLKSAWFILAQVVLKHFLMMFHMPSLFVFLLGISAFAQESSSPGWSGNNAPTWSDEPASSSYDYSQPWTWTNTYSSTPSTSPGIISTPTSVEYTTSASSLTSTEQMSSTVSSTSSSAVSTSGTVSFSPVPKPSASGPCKKIQYPFPSGTGGNEERAQAIIDTYVRSWNAYDEYAFGHDQLLPLNRSFTDPWNGWGVTIVDGIDTAIVMNLTDIVTKQLSFIPTINFTSSPDQLVEIFDINIRYVGGLLSAYDLLHSGLFPNPYSQSDVESLLTQAVSLANGLAIAYNTPTGLPAGDVNFTTMQPNYTTFTYENVTYNATNTAQAGTFILEWFRLSDLTGDETFRNLATKSESYLINPSPPPAYPGLVGTELNTDTGDFITFDGGWHSGVDSFLEYLIKTYIYDPTSAVTSSYLSFWLTAVQSTQSHIALSPYGFPDITFLSSLSEKGKINYAMDDFACFAGGNLLLGGSYLSQPSIAALGAAATDGCHATYNSTLTGLGGVTWAWYNSSNQAFNRNNDVDAARRAFAAEKGYFLTGYNWDFRPEPIESLFYAYRITGDEVWAEYAWEVFLAINATASNVVAVGEVANVDAPFGQRQVNNVESFWFAEVLKYLYLIFADPSVVSLDTFVFNTEAHPLLIQTGTCGALP